MAQFARPDGDNSIGAWDDSVGSAVAIPSQLYSTIDETSPSDSDYIFSEDDPATSVCNFTLSDVTDPVSSVDHIVRYRYAKENRGGFGTAAVINLTVRLRQGLTVIASTTLTDIGTNEVTGSFTLSGTEADSITDYADLLIEFEADKPSGDRNARCRVTWAAFEVPDFVTTHTADGTPSHGGATVSGDATYRPTRTANGTPSHGGATASGTARGTTRFGNGAVTHSGATASGTAFTLTRTASGGSSHSGATGSGNATHTPPQYTGDGTPSHSGATASGSGTHDKPTFAADGAVTHSGATATGFAGASATFTGDGTPSHSGATASGDGEHQELWRYVPVSDISTGSWTTGATDLWENLVLDDGTYIDSSLSPSSDSFTVAMRNLIWPETGYKFVTALRVQKVDSSGTPQDDGDVIDLTIEALNDGDVIYTWTMNDIGTDNGATSNDNGLTALGDYDAPLTIPVAPPGFHLRITANTSSSGAARKARISYAQFRSYDSDPPRRCLWWPCNCGNPNGCDDCVGSLEGIAGTATVTLSGATNGTCSSCAELNATHALTILPDPLGNPCQYFATKDDFTCSSLRVDVSVNYNTGAVTVSATDSASLSGAAGVQWFAQMMPNGSGWDCGSLTHTDFEEVSRTDLTGANCTYSALSLDGFTLS